MSSSWVSHVSVLLRLVSRSVAPAHDSAAPSGPVPADNGRRALSARMIAQRDRANDAVVGFEPGRREISNVTTRSNGIRERDDHTTVQLIHRNGDHNAVVGFEPARRALTDDIARLGNLPRNEAHPTVQLIHRDRDHAAVIGFEPGRRALTGDIAHITDLAGRAKRGDVSTQVKTETVTGAFTFYSCKDGWFTGIGESNGSSTSSGIAAMPASSSSSHSAIVPSFSESAGVGGF